MSMTHDDKETLSVCLCKSWPNRFTDEDLAYWCRRFNDYQVGEVVTALTEFKNHSRFVPKVHEILGRLKSARPVGADATESVKFPTFVQMLRRANRGSPRTDAELVLIHHWLQFHRSSKCDGSRVTTMHRCAMDLVDCGLSMEAAVSAATFVCEPRDVLARAMEDLRGERPASDVLEAI